MKLNTQITKIKKNAAEHFNINTGDLYTRNNDWEVSLYRQIICFVLYEDLGLKHEAIGLEIGKLHHSESARGVRRIKAILKGADGDKKHMIIEFLRQYGYCREWWGVREVA